MCCLIALEARSPRFMYQQGYVPFEPCRERILPHLFQILEALDVSWFVVAKLQSLHGRLPNICCQISFLI